MRRAGFVSVLSIGASAFALAASNPAQADTLQEALTSAYENNPILLAARAGQRATDEEVPIQRAQGLPTVSVAGAYTEFLKQSAVQFAASKELMEGSVSLQGRVVVGGGRSAAAGRWAAGWMDGCGVQRSRAAGCGGLRHPL